jgi:drug/metabolite transporter (DMT)-like permease
MTGRFKLVWPGVPLAIVSAVLFGASPPLAKLLLGGGVDPWLLASLLYLGSGFGLASAQFVRRILAVAPAEAPLRRTDLPWLALVVLTGGVVGPVLLMLGLSVMPASAAALLLNLEGFATMAIAWLAFRENVDRRVLLGALAILAGAVILSWQGGPSAGSGWGTLAIAGACLAWGVDNNLTRKLSAADPLQIAMAKGLVAGAVNLGLALLIAGAPAPGIAEAIGAGFLGFFSYGVSLVCFVLALRHLGTARTSAYYSTAPFIGAALAILVFGEPVTLWLVLAAALMALGVYLHLLEMHQHDHQHVAQEHEHRHWHDEHHRHSHGPADPPGEPHTHAHKHAPMTHKHPHYPDLHHRHGHATG